MACATPEADAIEQCSCPCNCLSYELGGCGRGGNGGGNSAGRRQLVWLVRRLW